MTSPDATDGVGNRAVTGSVAAHTFRLDVKAFEVLTALDKAGIFAVLLKGKAFADLLYGESHRRPYDDVDLLVSPESMGRVGEQLKALGFAVENGRALGAQTDPHLGVAAGALGDVYAETWVRRTDSLAIDVHDGLPEVAAPKWEAWSVLIRHLTEVQVAGHPVPTLDHVASALLAALHAGHHGPAGGRALADLERALRLLDRDTWRAAQALAIELNAQSGFGAGLGLLVAGRDLAADLGVSIEPPGSLRVLWRGAPWSASFLQALADAPGARARIDLLTRVIAPSPQAIRRGSPLARRPRGLAAAYVYRFVRMFLRLPWAVFTLVRSRFSRW